MTQIQLHQRGAEAKGYSLTCPVSSSKSMTRIESSYSNRVNVKVGMLPSLPPQISYSKPSLPCEMQPTVLSGSQVPLTLIYHLSKLPLLGSFYHKHTVFRKRPLPSTHRRSPVSAFSPTSSHPISRDTIPVPGLCVPGVVLPEKWSDFKSTRLLLSKNLMKIL